MALFLSEQTLEDRQEKKFIQAINEAYFGQTPGITKCFNAFCDFREKYVSKTNNIIRGIIHIDADHDKDLHRFCREMERQFGLLSFSFVVKNDLQANMYTYPILLGKNRLKGKPKDFIYVDKEGYHYKKEVEMNIIVCAYAAMLFDARLSNEEAFAIVLHEVGHNFQQFLHKNMFQLNLMYQIMYIYSYLISIININTPADIYNMIQGFVAIEPVHKKLGKFYNKLTADETKNNIYSYFNFLKGLSTLKDLSAALSTVLVAPVLGIVVGLKSILSSIISLPISAYDYLGEQMADNFPTYYGFGKAGVSSQLNMPYSMFGPGVDLVEKVPVVGHIYSLMLLPGEILINIGDCHPSSPTRARSMIDSMKTDVNDPSLSPTLRKELKKTIDETEKIVDDYYKEATKIKNPILFKELVDKFTYYNLRGGLKYRANHSIFNLDKGVQDMTNDLRENAYIQNTKII